MIITGTSQRDFLAAENFGDTVQALEGDDQIANSADGTTLIGGNGDDEYRLYSGETTIIETPDGGHDTVWVWRSYTLPEGVEDLLFRGSGDGRALRGNALNNVITAGNGDQAIAGLAGDDTLTGGSGADQFFYELGDGHDVIEDFEVGTDILSIWGTGQSFADLLEHADQVGADTVFSLSDGGTITLRNVSVRDLTQRDLLMEGLTFDPTDVGVLTFEDNFDTSASLSSGLWNTTPSNGHPSTALYARGPRFHSYVDEHTTAQDGTPLNLNPFSFDNGILSISAQPTPVQAQDTIPEPWVSGLLETHGTFAQTYGYFEIRARIPSGQGFWPAFWLMPEDLSWPPEIDLLEFQGSESDIYRAAVHASLWGTKVTAAQTWLIPDASDAFHTYGVLWTPQTVSFLFDGRVMFEVDTPSTMHSPMSLRLNLAIGGWEGGPDATTDPNQSYDIDYVRAYQIPGIAALPRAQDFSAFADVENGLLHTSLTGRLDLYGSDVWRTADVFIADLSLAPLEQATLVGDDGDNRLSGNEQATVFNGAGGNDLILGFAGNDYLIGEAGDDTLDGGQGEDTMAGGQGDDTYVLRFGDGAATPSRDLIVERVDEGFDTIVLADLMPDQIRSYIDWARWHIVVDDPSGNIFFALRVVPGIGGHDVGTQVERLVFADGTVWDLTTGLTLFAPDGGVTSSGTRFDDSLRGGDGDDTLIGMDGQDTLDGGEGVDLIFGWNGDDLLFDTGGDGGDSLFGEAGNDTLWAGDGIDILSGGAGNDSLRASADGDILAGDAGNDTLKGRNGDDTLSGGAGNDTVISGLGDDVLSGGDGADHLSGHAGNDVLHGGANWDRLIGGEGEDTLNGGAGRDWLRGGSGDDLFQMTLAELDGDRIQDFAAGDRIEINFEGNLSLYQIAIHARSITFENSVNGQIETLFVDGVQLSDLTLL